MPVRVRPSAPSIKTGTYELFVGVLFRLKGSGPETGTIHTGWQFNLMISFSNLLETGGLLITLLPTTAWDDTTYRTLRGINITHNFNQYSTANC